MGRPAPPGLTFDSGALLAFKARDRCMDVLVQRAKELRRPMVIPSGVLAQVWRGRGPCQARLAALVNSRDVTIQDLTRNHARAIGELCGGAGRPTSSTLRSWSRHGPTGASGVSMRA